MTGQTADADAGRDDQDSPVLGGEALLRSVATAVVLLSRRLTPGDPVYEDVGPTPRFIELARTHRRALAAAPPRRAPRPGKKRRSRA